MVPASSVGLAGKTLDGMAFTLFNGRVAWDTVGKIVNAPTATPTPSHTPTDTLTPSNTPTPTLTPTPVVLTVTKLQDTNDGVCSPTDCSLREAVVTAPSGSIINFKAGLTGTSYLGSQIVVDKIITITGPGADVITISGNNSTRLFFLEGGNYNLNISGLTFADGRVINSQGGAIYMHSGNATISDSIFRNNSATGGPNPSWQGTGGAVQADNGNLIINNSTFEGNTATQGGAIATLGTIVSINNSLFNNNTASVEGGAIYIYAYEPGYFVLANSTVTNNTTTSGNGGAIFNLRLSPPDGPNTHGIIINSTIVGNKGGVVGTTLKNSIIAHNIGWNCLENPADGGNNLQYPATDCGSSIPVAAPKLGPLQNNGGATLTMALEAGSPAIDAGNNTFCAASPVNNTDQRGMIRPVDGNSDSLATCDIGAYEAPESISPQPTLTPTGTPTARTLVVTKLQDTNDWVCDTDCSLREAIKLAENGDTITFATGVVGDMQALDEFTIRRSITITGPGWNDLKIKPTHNKRAFHITPGNSLTISEITIQGTVDNYMPGIGIHNEQGTLDMYRVAIMDVASSGQTEWVGHGVKSTGNATTSIRESGIFGIGGGGFVNSPGSGIYAEGILSVIDTSVGYNRTVQSGAGIYVHSGTALIKNSTVYLNYTRDGQGGGVYNADAVLTIVNSTIAENESRIQQGGGIYTGSGSNASTTIINSTIANNTAFSSGGGIYVFGPTSIANTIIANNTNGNCSGIPITDNGHNLQYPSTECGAGVAVGDPKLGPLQNNGSEPYTMALLIGTAAIDTGDNAICAAAPVNNLDQRGIVRPLNGNATGAAICDIGAYEADEGTNVPTLTPSSTNTPVVPTNTHTPSPTPTATPFPGVLWVDDALPAGAVGAGVDGWNWISSNPAPDSGALSHQSIIQAGQHGHSFTGATNRLTVNTGDTLIASVYLDPANPPTEIMLSWREYGNNSWEHRAYWGANSINAGVNGTNSRRYMGVLPAAGGWVRLRVPAAQVGLAGKTVDGMSFTLFNGRAFWDRAGKETVPASLPTNTPTR